MWLLTRDRQEAEEVTQEAFLRLWERWDRIADAPDPVAYLYRTALNVWRSRLRRVAVAARKVIHHTRREDEMEERRGEGRGRADASPRFRPASERPSS